MTVGFCLALSPDQVAMRDRLREISREVLRGQAADAERDGVDLGGLAGQLDSVGISPAVLFDEGITDPHTLIVALEELAYGDAGIAWAAVPWFQLAIVLDACADAAQRETARQIFAANPGASARVLLYEDFGRQPTEYETSLSGSPEVGWNAYGHKASVAHPDGADISLLVGREGDEVAAFCFAGGRPGATAERNDRDTGKIAITAVPSGPVTIDALALTAQERLAGGLALHRAVGQARLLLAATLLGLSRASLEFCSAYAVHRTTWGTPLAQYQGVSFPLIEHSTELEEVRLLVWDAAARLTGAQDVAEIERIVTRAVNRASSLGLRATRDGVQLIGVRGITRDLPVERWYRSAAVLGAIDFDVFADPFGPN